MKVFAAAFLILLPASALPRERSVVEVASVEPSFEHVRVLTLHNGSPLDKVKLEVFSWKGRRRLSISTNREGVAKFLLAPPGRYRIAADAANGLGAELILDVSKGKGKNESSFTLNLDVRPLPPPTLEERIVAAEAAGPARIRQFAGVVVDPGGAVIPQTRIEVFKNGSQGKLRSAKTESDRAGHFVARLPYGFYTAVFSVQGFSTYIVAFEIAKGDDSADANDLKIMLQLGPVT